MKINFKLIQEILDEKKWTHTDLADKMGVTRQSVCNQFNHGAKSFATAEKYAKALKMKAKDLII
jgi:DNA-binding XRE family transcriptional regulator